MESTIGLLLAEAVAAIPFDTINALANSVTAVAVLWGARSLRRTLADIRILRIQPEFSHSSAPSGTDTYKLTEERPREADERRPT